MYQLSYNYFVTEINVELFKRVKIQPSSTCLTIFNNLEIATNHNFIGVAKSLLREEEMYAN